MVHFRSASNRCGKSQSCQLSSVRTKSPRMPSNLSSVILTYPFGDTSDESISAFCWFQNQSQSVCVPLNFVITSFGNLALIDLSFLF